MLLTLIAQTFYRLTNICRSHILHTQKKLTIYRPNVHSYQCLYQKTGKPTRRLRTDSEVLKEYTCPVKLRISLEKNVTIISRIMCMRTRMGENARMCVRASA